MTIISPEIVMRIVPTAVKMPRSRMAVANLKFVRKKGNKTSRNTIIAINT
ncbi:MAG: hypothetical protein GF383_01765 [Candidatus Lokiarchaeota archaeon]|nr:hypothetical protein [Candidatus Lokiarchaeota archaeon]